MNFYFNLNVPNYIHVMCFLYIRYNNALKLYIYIYIYIYSESRLHRNGCVSYKNVDIGGLSI